jgi:hypothetical protein
MHTVRIPSVRLLVALGALLLVGCARTNGPGGEGNVNPPTRLIDDRDRTGTLPPPAGGAIAGKVTTAEGEPVAGASISISGAGEVPLDRIMTDEHGAYTVQSLDQGRYEVTAVLAGYRPGHVEVIVSEGATARGDLVLEPESS